MHKSGVDLYTRLVATGALRQVSRVAVEEQVSARIYRTECRSASLQGQVCKNKHTQLKRNCATLGGSNGSTSTVNTISDIEDKPPSYDTILRLDGAPPDYYSLQCEKPPRYEDLGSFFSMPHVESSATTDDLPQVHHFEATNPVLASTTCLESTATSSCLESPSTAPCYVSVASRRSSSNEEDELFPCGGSGGDDELVRGPELVIETSSLARSSFRRVSSVLSTSESEKLYVETPSPCASLTPSASAPHLTDKILFHSEAESSS
ncbi:uncharacterized protein LOC143017698 [Oratosquilla oratoria]|uniref:uncharacterized protein LOC143017698 n=1 Tax=Oratosquilla oratoria TaxID=337810 RepID=UPI003F75CCD4